MPRIYILCGYAFAGKTTLARALVRRLDLSCVSIDEINNTRGIGLNNSWISLEDWHITYAESYRRLGEYLRAGCSVVYDAGNFNRVERNKARAIAAQNDSDTLVIYVTTSASVVRQRWLRNRVTGERNDIRDDYFEIGLASFELPSEEENVLLYHTEQDVDGWIEQHLDLLLKT